MRASEVRVRNLRRRDLGLELGVGVGLDVGRKTEERRL